MIDIKIPLSYIGFCFVHSIISHFFVSIKSGRAAAAIRIFEAVQNTENFGNGRFARNVLEQAEMRQSQRLMKMGFNDADDKETLFRLEKDDFNLPALMPKEETKHTIGFVS